ncbi:MAG: DUF3106 domain-containing protein [Rhodospirillales bacterium]
MRGFLLLFAIALGWNLMAGPAAAQRSDRPAVPPPKAMRRGPATMLDRLERMSPEERRRVLDKLPPQRRRQLEQRLKRYDAMPPEQRERLRRQLSLFRSLPPERQEQTRQLFRRFTELPEDRRQEIRRAVRALGRLDEERRRSRLESPAFRERFNPEEQKIVRELLQVAFDAEPPNE